MSVGQNAENFFQCDNKGCYPTMPITLALTNPNSFPTTFTANIAVEIPQPKATGQFTIDFIGTDQTHNNVVVGTLALTQTCTSDNDCPPGSYCQMDTTPPWQCH